MEIVIDKPLVVITLGCSWTYGVGVGWNDGMDRQSYEDVAWNQGICEQHSWRGLLSEKVNAINLNLSAGGSSNQQQLRLAKTYFLRDDFKSLINNHRVVVIWGITSTSRNELYDLEQDALINFSYTTSESSLAKMMLKYSYQHQHEVFMLCQEMLHWDDFFEKFGVRNYWVDTFNHHDYKSPNPGILRYHSMYQDVCGKDWPSWDDFCHGHWPLDPQIASEISDVTKWEFASLVSPKITQRLVLADSDHRDLMSQMCIAHGMTDLDQKYHTSMWKIDNDRTKFLVKQKLLNPISHHPTKEGHRWIADFLIDNIDLSP